MLLSLKKLFAQAVIPLALVSTVNAASIGRRATVCNGHAELCSKLYSNVVYVGAHNSYAVGTNSLAVNQDHDVTAQLNDGIRMLQLQTHNLNGAIQLCHTSCSLFNGGTLESYLGKVKLWMDANPNDVVTLLIVNSDKFKASNYATVFKAAGLDKLSYTPPSAALPSGQWPTLGSLIDAGTRLVTFMTPGADFASVPYIIDEFANMWETAFDVTDPTFDCAVNRSSGDTSTQMYLINHFLDKIVLGQPAPFPEQANVTNAASGAGSLGAQVDTCVANYQVPPTFMLVDFYEFGGGSVFQVAASLNGVSYQPTSPIATPLATGTSGSTSTTVVPLNSAKLASIGTGHWVATAAVLLGMMAGAIGTL